MSEPGDRMAARYRELAREAPPPALDAAILAASRRAVGARPGGAQRWFVPLSVAAVLVLGIGVALRMQVEQPGVETALPANEYPVPQAAAPVEADRAKPEAPAAAAQASKRSPEPAATESRAAEPAPAPSRRAAQQQSNAPPQARPPASARDAAATPAPAPAVPAPAVPPAAVMERSPPPAALERSFAPDPAPGAAPPAPALRSAPPPAQGMAIQSAPREKREAAADALSVTPDAELERIAKLREAGRQDEADRALAEFQRRFPDHRIPAAVWERVRPR